MGDNQTFKSLEPEFVPFLYFLPDFNGIAGLNVPALSLFNV